MLTVSSSPLGQWRGEAQLVLIPMKIVIGIIVLLAAFCVVVALQPSSYRVERSVVIAASPAEIFPYVNDLKKCDEWSPWRKLDPNAKGSYEGPAAGVGAKSSWSGNNQIGEGSQTIVESVPGQRVRTQLDFRKPMEAVALAEFTLEPRGNDTRITWSMWGENNFVGKAMCFFMDQDKMIGTPFEEGLAELKSTIERKPAVAAADTP
jgi:hypothetical protein